MENFNNKMENFKNRMEKVKNRMKNFKNSMENFNAGNQVYLWRYAKMVMIGFIQIMERNQKGEVVVDAIDSVIGETVNLYKMQMGSIVKNIEWIRYIYS